MHGKTTPVPAVTIALVGVVLIGFLAGVASGVVPTSPTAAQLVAAGASFGPRTLDGEWWRVLTAAMLHAGWAHVLLNVVTLGVVAAMLEQRVSRTSVGLAFVGAAAVGTAAGTAQAPYAVIVGASSGALGVAAALVVVAAAASARSKRVVRPDAVAMAVGGVVIVLQLVIGLGRDDVDHAGHIAGMGTGAVIGAAAAATTVAAAAAAAAAAAVVVAVMMTSGTPYEPRRATARLVAIEARFDAIVDMAGGRKDMALALEEEIVAPLEALVTDARLDDGRLPRPTRERIERLRRYARARADVVKRFAQAVRDDDVAPLPEIARASRAADAVLDGPLP